MRSDSMPDLGFATARPGDLVMLVYDRSNSGHLPCRVVWNDGALITLAPRNRPRRNQDYIQACAVTRRVPCGGKAKLIARRRSNAEA